MKLNQIQVSVIFSKSSLFYVCSINIIIINIKFSFTYNMLIKAVHKRQKRRKKREGASPGPNKIALLRISQNLENTYGLHV